MQPEIALRELIEYYVGRLRQDSAFCERVDSILSSLPDRKRGRVKEWLQTGAPWSFTWAYPREPQDGPVVAILIEPDEPASLTDGGESLGGFAGETVERDPATGAFLGYRRQYTHGKRGTFTVMCMSQNADEAGWMYRIVERAVLEDIYHGVPGRGTTLMDEGMRGEFELRGGDLRPDERYAPSWCTTRFLSISMVYEHQWEIDHGTDVEHADSATFTLDSPR